MPSHHHRDDEDYEVIIVPTRVQTVNTEQLDKVLDTVVLDAVLDFITTERGMAEYVAETMGLANSSQQYQKIAERIMSSAPDKLDGQSTLKSKLTAMWSIGFLAGASCAVKAVDEGLIINSDEGDDEEGDYDNG